MSDCLLVLDRRYGSRAKFSPESRYVLALSDLSVVTTLRRSVRLGVRFPLGVSTCRSVKVYTNSKPSKRYMCSQMVPLLLSYLREDVCQLTWSHPNFCLVIFRPACQEFRNNLSCFLQLGQFQICNLLQFPETHQFFRHTWHQKLNLLYLLAVLN
jgi:hypothetical protein